MLTVRVLIASLPGAVSLRGLLVWLVDSLLLISLYVKGRDGHAKSLWTQRATLVLFKTDFFSPAALHCYKFVVPCDIFITTAGSFLIMNF